MNITSFHGSISTLFWIQENEGDVQQNFGCPVDGQIQTPSNGTHSIQLENPVSDGWTGSIVYSDLDLLKEDYRFVVFKNGVSHQKMEKPLQLSYFVQLPAFVQNTHSDYNIIPNIKPLNLIFTLILTLS